ncbi:Response regulator receiver domain-containing protein [Rhizobium sp. RU20A]|nr:Response regulator receiver domain-containing protein [Rhizobium sp. RU20A]
MACKILIVEDEFIVATEIEYLVAESGNEPVGIAADMPAARRLADKADVAFVDLNLRDGPTGHEIGRMLAQEHNVTVIYITANPSQLGRGVPGTLGVIPKPVTEHEMTEAINFAIAVRTVMDSPIRVPAPSRLRLFSFNDGEGAVA